MTAPIIPSNPDAATTVTVPSGADMPATVTNGVRRSVEYVGRGEWQNRLRDAERNLAALDAHVKEHPEAAEAAKAPRALYEEMRDDANRALAQQNAAPVEESATPETPPARSGAPEAPMTDTITNHVAGEGEE